VTFHVYCQSGLARNRGTAFPSYRWNGFYKTSSSVNLRPTVYDCLAELPLTARIRGAMTVPWCLIVRMKRLSESGYNSLAAFLFWMRMSELSGLPLSAYFSELCRNAFPTSSLPPIGCHKVDPARILRHAMAAQLRSWYYHCERPCSIGHRVLLPVMPRSHVIGVF